MNFWVILCTLGCTTLTSWARDLPTPTTSAALNLKTLGVHPESELFKDLAQQLGEDPHFRELFNLGDETAIKKYTHSHLTTEVMTALRDPQYPTTRFLAIQRFIQKESELKTTNELAREASKKLFPRYQKFFSDHPEQYILSSRLNPEEVMGKDFYLNWLNKTSPSDQINFYSRLRESHPENSAVRDAFSEWLFSITEKPIKNPNLFTQMMIRLPEQKISGYENYILDAYLEVYAKKGEPLAKQIIEELQNNKMALPLERKILIEYTTQSPTVGQATQVKNYLFPRFDRGTVVDLSDLLKPGEFSLRPDSQKPFDQSLQRLIENRVQLAHTEHYKPIGVTAYAKLIDENPKLAKKYFSTFYKQEFIPSLSSNADASIQKAIHYLKRNTDPVALKAITDGINSFQFAESLKYKIQNRFESLLPLFDLESKEGAKFIYEYATPEQWKQKTELRQAIQKHFDHLSKNQKALQEEMKHFAFKADVLIHTDDLPILLSNRPDILKRFTETYFNLLDAKLRVLPPQEAAKSSEKLLRTYLESTDSDPEFAQKLLKQWREFAKSEASTPRVAALSEGFEKWIHERSPHWAAQGKWPVKDHQKISPCDLPKNIRSLLIRN